MPTFHLKENTDPTKVGHVFCSTCNTELMIDLTPWVGYRHPHYEPAWNEPWHEFHNLRVIYPDLMGRYIEKDFRYTCPVCASIDVDQLIFLDGQILDAQAVLKSLTRQKMWHCDNCGNHYASNKCVKKCGRGYICNDCISYC